MNLPLRPLAASWTLLIAALAALGLEGGVRALYEAPAPMLRKALAYQQAPTQGDQLLVMGTCLPEQIIHVDQLSERLSADVHLLASPAASTRLFTLVLRNFVPEDAPIKAILVPYGRRDLTSLMAPWESQVMELASWRDLPEIVAWGCGEDRECAGEMWMRKASRAYRYRGFLANRFWYALGTRPPVPGYVMSPGAVDPQDERGFVPGQPPSPRANEAAKGPQPQAGGGAQGMGWERQKKELAEADEARFVYLRAFLEEGQDRGVRMLFTPLPERSAFTSGGAHRDPGYDKALQAVITEGGGELLTLEDIPGLSAQHFEDDVHLTVEGQRLVTAAIGDELSGSMEP